MRYPQLGRWGMQVSEISLGSWLTFGGSVDERVAIDCMHRAFDLGVTFFDTANVYATGRSEQVVGRAIKDLPREEIVLASKVFFPMSERPNRSGLSRKHITEECHASLRRLGQETIDLYQCHRYDEQTPLEETCRAMDDLIRRGDVVYWGVSEWTAAQLLAAAEVCEREGLHPPVSDQPRYSLIAREIESEVLPACRELGMGVVVFSPLGQGVLTGKYHAPDDRPAGTRAADPEGVEFLAPHLTADNLAVVDRLRPIADELGITLAQLALAWALHRDGVTSVIVGASRVEQVDDNVAAADVRLPQEIVELIDAAAADPKG